MKDLLGSRKQHIFIEKVDLVKTKSTVSIRLQMCCWSLLKTGHCVWLKFASIFHSLTLQMAKTLVKVIRCRYVCYRICRRNRSFSSLNCQCTAIKFQVTHWNPLLRYDYHSVSSSASLTHNTA